MADITQLESALIKADAAGDVDGARVLAGEIRRMRSVPAEGMDSAEKTPKEPFKSWDERYKNATFAEKAMGEPATRFALGMSQVIAAPFQLGANIGDKIVAAMGQKPVVGKWTNEKLAQLEALKRRGMTAHTGNEIGEDWDVAGFGGSFLPGAVTYAGISNALPKGISTEATGAAGRFIGRVLAGGGAAGLTVPDVSGEENVLSDKGAQTAIAGLAAGAVPPLASGTWKTAKALGRTIRDTSDLVLPGGAKRIADKYTEKTLFGSGRDKLIDALRNIEEFVPGSKPTAAQAVAHLPEGSPIAAHQKIIAATPPDISTKFGQRILDQREALKQAALERNEVTAPMREAALKAANQAGLKSDSIISNIETMQRVPGQRASGIVQKTLESVKEKIKSLTNDKGIIDAEDLYTVRKEIGNIIETHAKETANWDKKLASGLQKNIQSHIDDAIENSGGAGWKQYLAEFSRRSQDIEKEIARTKAAIKPIQKANLQGGINISEETRTHIPQLLSRPAMMINAGLRYGGMNIEPKVDKIMADRYLNPRQFASDFEKTQKGKIMADLLRKTKTGNFTSEDFKILQSVIPLSAARLQENN